MKYRFAACATLVLCFCLALTLPLMAQTQPSDSQTQSSTERSQTVTGAQAHGAEQASQVSQMLNLSPQQQQQLTPILEQEGPKVADIKNDSHLSADEKKDRIKKVNEQTDKLVKPILTPIQWKQWETYRKTQRADIK